ncbi:MAG: hypothetical protein Q4B73_02180 [Lachnospiraceae bacterium]|nr:hypothetical protein [Lachnospiraceae bacterium]
MKLNPDAALAYKGVKSASELRCKAIFRCPQIFGGDKWHRKAPMKLNPDAADSLMAEPGDQWASEVMKKQDSDAADSMMSEPRDYWASESNNEAKSRCRRQLDG